MGPRQALQIVGDTDIGDTLPECVPTNPTNRSSGGTTNPDGRSSSIKRPVRHPTGSRHRVYDLIAIPRYEPDGPTTVMGAAVTIYRASNGWYDEPGRFLTSDTVRVSGVAGVMLVDQSTDRLVYANVSYRATPPKTWGMYLFRRLVGPVRRTDVDYRYRSARLPSPDRTGCRTAEPRRLDQRSPNRRAASVFTNVANDPYFSNVCLMITVIME